MKRPPHGTGQFACTRAIKKILIEGCKDPEALIAIIKRADALAFTRPDERPAAIAAFDAFCESLPCLPWFSDERSRHVEVRIYGEGERNISVARAMWAVVHVVSQQGTQLERDELLHHSCGMNGQHATGRGCCLNPAHFIRGDQAVGAELTQARRVLRKYGATV